MTRKPAIVLSGLALLVLALASIGIAIEPFSVLVRPISFSLNLGHRSVEVPPFHWRVCAAIAAVAITAMVWLKPIAFPTRKSSVPSN